MKPIKALKRWFKKPKPKQNKVNLKISFKQAVSARLEKAPPEGLFCLELNQPVTILKEVVLIYCNSDKEKVFFRVLTNFIAIKNQAPDGAIISFTVEQWDLFTKQKKYKKV